MGKTHAGRPADTKGKHPIVLNSFQRTTNSFGVRYKTGGVLSAAYPGVIFSFSCDRITVFPGEVSHSFSTVYQRADNVTPVCGSPTTCTIDVSLSASTRPTPSTCQQPMSTKFGANVFLLVHFDVNTKRTLLNFWRQADQGKNTP